MATLTAATNSSTDVQTTINSAVDGDTVVIPDGTVTWNSGVTISGKGIHLKGATKYGPIITNSCGAGTMIDVTKDASHSTEVSNLKVWRGISSAMHLAVDGSGKTPLVHDCYFDMKSVSPQHSLRLTANGGVFWNCEFRAGTVKPPAGGANYGDYHLDGGIQINPGAEGDTIWTQPHTLGMADSNGTANTYFEDCIFEGLLGQSTDVSNGGKIVMRHCDFYDAAVVFHGADGDLSGGGRHFEYYNNTFHRVYNTQAGGAVPINRWFYLRGGTGVILDNVIPRSSTSDNYYPGTPDIALTIQYLRRNIGDYACWNTGHPAPHQIGQVTDARDATPDFPVAINGNTGTGTSDSNFIALQDYEGIEMCDPLGPPITDYIQLGRDYITTSPANYTKFTYPHPLRTDLGPAADPDMHWTASAMRRRRAS